MSELSIVELASCWLAQRKVPQAGMERASPALAAQALAKANQISEGLRASLTNTPPEILIRIAGRPSL